MGRGPRNGPSLAGRPQTSPTSPLLCTYRKTPAYVIDFLIVDGVVQDGTLCDANGRLGPKQFEVLMRRQVILLALSAISAPVDVGSAQLPEAKTKLHRMNLFSKLLVHFHRCLPIPPLKFLLYRFLGCIFVLSM